MAARMKFYMVTAILGVVAWGCTGLVPGKQAHMVFLDFTASASTFVGDNPARVEGLIREIALEMKPEDVVEVYPIHAYTASAVPIVRLGGPPLRGDLRDKQRLRKWQEEAVSKGLERVWHVRFEKDRTSSTNIYPVVRKILRLRDNGYRVRVYLICDMIQDFDGEDFSVVFSNGSNVGPVELARKKVAELGFEDVLNGVKVMVMIPGTPSGNQAYDRIRAKVNAFWDELFARCGTNVVIEDL